MKGNSIHYSTPYDAVRYTILHYAVLYFDIGLLCNIDNDQSQSVFISSSRLWRKMINPRFNAKYWSSTIVSIRHIIDMIMSWAYILTRTTPCCVWHYILSLLLIGFLWWRSAHERPMVYLRPLWSFRLWYISLLTELNWLI